MQLRILTWLRLQTLCHSQAWYCWEGSAVLASACSPYLQWQSTPGLGNCQAPKAGVGSNGIWEVSISMWMALPQLSDTEESFVVSPAVLHTLFSIHPPSCSNSSSSTKKPPTLLYTKAQEITAAASLTLVLSCLGRYTERPLAAPHAGQGCASQAACKRCRTC